MRSGECRTWINRKRKHEVTRIVQQGLKVSLSDHEVDVDPSARERGSVFDSVRCSKCSHTSSLQPEHRQWRKPTWPTSEGEQDRLVTPGDVVA